MAVGAAESDCVEFEALPTVTGFELFPSAPRQNSQNNHARNSRPSRLCHAPYASSGLIYDARNENFRTPASTVMEYPNPTPRKTIFHENSKLARHPWADSAEFIELWSDIPSENTNHDWTDRRRTDSDNDSALMSSLATGSRISRKLSRHPRIASEEFVELWSDIPNEYGNSRNQYKDQRVLMDQNNRISISNGIADLEYDSSVIYWDSRKHRCSESEEFVELWSDIPNEYGTSQNQYKDHGELMDENRTSISNVAADIKYNSSVVSWDPRKHCWTAPKDFVELWSDIPDEFDSSKHQYTDRRKLMDQNNRTSVSNAIADLEYDSSVICWDFSKYRRSESEEFVELWSDIPIKYGTSRNQYMCQGELMDQNNRTSISNAAADIKYSSSVVTWDPSKNPRTASKDFVVLWSDIPDEFDENQNQSGDQNGSSLSKVVIDREQSGFCENSCTEAENLTEVSSITPEDSISNKNYFGNPENNIVACCRLLSECFCHFPRFVYHICFLLMMTLLLVFSISAVYMGMAYFGTCPSSLMVSHFVYLTGIAGAFLIGIHIGYRFAKEAYKESTKLCAKLFLIFTSILLLIEMIFFYSLSPSPENSEYYCDETFYNFTFYANIAAAGIVFLSVLLHFTSLKHLVNNLAF